MDGATNLDISLNTPKIEQAIRAAAVDPVPSESGLDITRQAEATLSKLKQAITAVIHGLDEEIHRGIDVSKVLGLNRALGWAIHRVITAPDGISAEPYMPTQATLRRFLLAAGEKGASPQAVARTYEAFNEFEALVRRHARDRATFSTMLRDLQGDKSNTDNLKLRRTAYKVQRELLGVHADLFFQMSMFVPDADMVALDHVNVKGWVNIQRIRSSSSFLSENGILLRNGDGDALPMPEPIEPGATSEIGLSLLQRFCSRPLPQFRSFKEGDTLITQAYSEEVGKQSAATYFIGGVVREPVRTRAHPLFRVQRSYMTVSAEVFIRDLWIHRSMCIGKPPYAEVYYQRPTFIPTRTLEAADILPDHAEVEMLGTGIDADMGKEIARYPELVCYIAEKRGYPIDEFTLYRCRVEYPILGSIIRVVVPMAE